VRVPPTPATSIGAEFYLLTAGDLLQCFPTTAATFSVRSADSAIDDVSGNTIPAAERRNLVLRQAQCFSYSSISVTGTTQLPDLFFLFFGHDKTPPVISHWKRERRFDDENKKTRKKL